MKIIGAGHFPDSAGLAKRTFIWGDLRINKGADSLRLEGLYIEGPITYDNSNSINYVKVIRCRLGYVAMNSNSEAKKNNCSFEECFIVGGISFGYYGTNLLIQHSIISDNPTYGNLISGIRGGALIKGNILLVNPQGGSAINDLQSSQIENNVIIGSVTLTGLTNNNIFKNNLFNLSSIDFTGNTFSNNYTGVEQTDIFINQDGEDIYTHDYHLKSPQTYIGTDGTQVGFYGGIPFKEHGLPSNPQIIKKNIAAKTDVNGNLQISITVKAQDY